MNSLKLLPPELLNCVFEYLSVADIAAVRLTDRYLSKYAETYIFNNVPINFRLAQNHKKINNCRYLFNVLKSDITNLSPYVKSIKFEGDVDLSVVNKFKYLTHLNSGYHFTNGGKPLSSGVLPCSLTHLTFGHYFANGIKPFVPGVLAENLTHLTFGHFFTNGSKPLSPGVLPCSLTHLTFGHFFTNGKQPISSGVLPCSLTHLTFGHYFTNGGQKLVSGVLPCSFTHLKICSTVQFDQTLPSHITIEYIYNN